jgi:pyruvate kinase
MTTRATKIVATLGPASSDPVLLEQMIRAGVNMVRLNFSHGKAQDHIDRAELVRAAAKRAGCEVAIMAKSAKASCWTPAARSWATSLPWAWTTKTCRAT